MNQIHFSPIHISWASSLCNLIIAVVSVNVLVGAVLLPRPSEPNVAWGSEEELRCLCSCPDAGAALHPTWGHPFWPPGGVCALELVPLTYPAYRVFTLLCFPSHFTFGQDTILNKKTGKQMGCGFQTSRLQHHDRNQESTQLRLQDRILHF